MSISSYIGSWADACEDEDLGCQADADLGCQADADEDFIVIKKAEKKVEKQTSPIKKPGTFKPQIPVIPLQTKITDTVVVVADITNAKRVKMVRDAMALRKSILSVLPVNKAKTLANAAKVGIQKANKKENIFMALDDEAKEPMHVSKKPDLRMIDVYNYDMIILILMRLMQNDMSVFDCSTSRKNCILLPRMSPKDVPVADAKFLDANLPSAIIPIPMCKFGFYCRGFIKDICYHFNVELPNAEIAGADECYYMHADANKPQGLWINELKKYVIQSTMTGTSIAEDYHLPSACDPTETLVMPIYRQSGRTVCPYDKTQFCADLVCSKCVRRHDDMPTIVRSLMLTVVADQLQLTVRTPHDLFQWKNRLVQSGVVPDV
jgi:hypothetical protein